MPASTDREDAYHVMHEGMLWFVDEFCGDNAGLVLAEVELDHPAQPVRLPPWVGDEVTQDPRYRNSSLVDEPQGSFRRDAC
jgi:CYTH domain-containing protein